MGPARSRERAAVTAVPGAAYAARRSWPAWDRSRITCRSSSQDGFAIADFIHEGNGDIWELALETGPAPHAGWMLVEEQSEGGDVLARASASDPAFARGMKRVCEGGGVALYDGTDSNSDAKRNCLHVIARLQLLPPEPDPDREVVGPAAEIDLVEPAKPIVEVGFGARDSASRRRRSAVSPAEADAAEHDGPGRVALRDELIAEDRDCRAEVDELADLAVPPVDDAEARAEVRLHARSPGRAAARAP